MDSHQETLIYHDKNHLYTIIHVYYKYYYELLYIYVIVIEYARGLLQRGRHAGVRGIIFQ